MNDNDTTDGSTATAPASTSSGPRETKRWQKITSVVLLVIGFILVPLSGIAIWSHNQLTNTDRYVETVGPLASNQDIQELTRLFQGISTTMEFGRRLSYYYDHQKLGLDEELKRMDQMAQEGALAELQAVAPILQKIAGDSQVMHIDQQHAQHLLQMGSAGSAGSGRR